MSTPRYDWWGYVKGMIRRYDGGQVTQREAQAVRESLEETRALPDEAALFPRNFIEQMMGRCSVAGAKVFLNCNPASSAHYVKTELIDRAEEKEIYHLHFTMEDNLALSQETRDRFCRMFTGVFYKRFIPPSTSRTTFCIWEEGEPLQAVTRYLKDNGYNPVDDGFYAKIGQWEQWYRGNQLIELTFALGTGAFVEYTDGEEVKIDYIRAGMVYPLSWDNGRVIECAFASERKEGKKTKVYLNIHRLDGGQYVIENKMFLWEGGTLRDTALPEGVTDVVRTGSQTPLFQLLTPNIVNNLDPDCPMGVSVFANAIDQLEGADLVYDSYCNEFRLGKKRILVPLTMARMQMQEDGTTNPVFDENDTEFFAFDPGQNEESKITDINMELRHEAHEAGMKTALSLLSGKCGLGSDRYRFEHGNVTAKTATEVVSEKSELFQNLKKHEFLLDKTIRDLCRAVAFLLGYTGAFAVTIHFDDSIIEDRPAQQQRDLQQVRDRVMALWEYRMKYFGQSEEAARAMAAELAGGSPEDTDPFGFDRGGGS